MRSRESSAACCCRSPSGPTGRPLKRSLELYANHVIPHFSGANDNRFASYDWVTENQDELVTKRVNAANQMFAKHEAERGSKAEASARADAVRDPVVEGSRTTRRRASGDRPGPKAVNEDLSERRWRG